MSEKMYPIPFDSLMNWVTSEYAQCGDVFGVHKHYHASGKSLPIFGERIETPFGPAAGPNSQLAQNIIAAYAPVPVSSPLTRATTRSGRPS